MDVAVRLFALLVYTFGVFVYGALLALWTGEMGRVGWGTRRRRAEDAGSSRAADVLNGVLLIISFLWFVCNVSALVIRMIPRGSSRILDIVTVFLAFAFPPVIMHISWAQVCQNRDQPLAPGWRLALWPMYIACVAIPMSALAIVLGIANPAWLPIADRLIGTGLSVAFIVTAVYCIAVITRKDRNANLAARQRQARRSILILFACMIAVFVLVFAITLVTDNGPRPRFALGDILEVVAKSLPLVFVFVGTYYENRFQFFDIFVKRGAGFLMAIAVLTMWLAVMLPLMRPVVSTAAAPWIFAIALTPAVIVIAWLYVVLSTTLDRRWLGRRFSPSEALSHFMGALRSATTEPQLMARAQEGLKDIFGADAVVTLDSDPAQAAGAVQSVPIRSGDQVVGQFLMGSRVSDTPYFSEDVQLLGSLGGVFSHVLENLRLQERKLEQEHRARELSLHASRSELKALRAQINPHFLFNALNSIAGLIHRDPAVADRTIEQLADVFRYALRGAESEWAILDDELEFVRAYLEVERARFGERLRTDVRVDPAARGARIPTMIVQTLVENAVKHGASTLRGAASVIVDARAEDGRLVVSVSDNGPGFSESDLPAAPRAGGGYGLVNVRQRLDGYFGSRAALSAIRQDGMTVVSVSLPLVRQEPRPQSMHEAVQ
jgi:signal transduction histidine kinase